MISALRPILLLLPIAAFAQIAPLPGSSPAPLPSNFGLFHAGRWSVDVNGDHKFSVDDQSFVFGRKGDIPVVGDWDNTGVLRVGVFRKGEWFLDINGDHQFTCNGVCDGLNGNDLSFRFGREGDIPVVGDWTYTGKQRIGVFRSGQWLLDIDGDRKFTCRVACDGLNGDDESFIFGQAGDIPVVGDWDFAFIQRIGVFRDGEWLLDLNGDHQFTAGVDLAVSFGQAGDLPVVGDWTHNSLERIGVFRQGQWILDMDHSFNPANAGSFEFGQAGDMPVVVVPCDASVVNTDPDWVASWGASASNVSSVGPYATDSTIPGYLNSCPLPSTPCTVQTLPPDVTIREVAHLSIGSNSLLRLRFSNALSSEPVTFSSVHAALSQSGSGSSAIAPGSDRTVTFQGSTGVTIPAGVDVYSDPVNLVTAPAAADVAVSFYIPGTPPTAATVHNDSGNTIYYATGGDASRCIVFNVACPAVEFPIAASDLRSGIRPYLTGAEVHAPGSSAVVVLGDSITDGAAVVEDSNHRWPDYLASSLAAAGVGLGVVNAGIGSDCVLVGCNKPRAIGRFQRDVLSVAGAKYLIVFEGVNDIGLTGNRDAVTPGYLPLLTAELIAAYQSLVARAHAQGITVYGATITPFGTSGYFDNTNETLRRALNTFIRRPGNFDAVIDFDELLRDPLNPSSLNPIYIPGALLSDGLHPNDAAYQAMATYVASLASSGVLFRP